SWLESSFNAMHNAMSNVPGQTGASSPLRPLDLFGRQNDQRALEKIAGLLPPEKRLELRLPFLSYAEANLTLEQCLRARNNRRGHKLEGFDAISIWRWKTDPPGPWLPMSAWPAPLPEGAEKNIALKHVNETPLERAAKLAVGCCFEKMAASIAYSFLDRHQKFVDVDKNIIEVGIEGKTYKFRDEALCQENGVKYIAYFDPRGVQDAADSRNPAHDLGKLYLVRMDGSFAGTANLWFGPSRSDVERHEEMQAEKARVYKTMRKRVTDRNGRALERSIADTERNLELAAEAMPAVQLATPAQGAADPVPASGMERMAADMRSAEARHASRKNVDVIQELLNEP
ncbi:MAG: hypothetical protein Q8K85_02305, partial [Hyphomicrobium sp.]|nr:hypothetical protein [Hyphomicrobium sp.]